MGGAARVRLLYREAFQNAYSSGFRASVLLLAICLALLFPAFVDANAARRIASQEKALILAGSTMRVVDAPGYVDTAACESLADSSSIIASGTVRLSVATVSRTGESPVRTSVASVSPGIVEILESLGWIEHFRPGGSVNGVQAYGTDDMAKNLGVVPGVVEGALLTSVLGARQVPATVIGISHLGDLLPQATGSALVQESPRSQMSDACLILASPGAEKSAEGLAAIVALGAPPAQRIPRRVLFESKFTINPAESMMVRPTRNLFWVGGIGAAGLWLAPLAFRRSEVGLYLSVGLRRHEVALIRSAESIIFVVFAFLIDGFCLLFFGAITTDAAQFIWRICYPEIAISLAVSICAAILGSSLSTLQGNAASMVKDR